MKNLIILFLAALLIPTASAQLLKCTDPKTGKVTFSDTPCKSEQSAQRIETPSGNPANDRNYSGGWKDAYGNSMAKTHAMKDELDRRRAENQAQGPRVTSLGDSSQARRERDAAISAASTPLPGAHGLTASQLRALGRMSGDTSDDSPHDYAPPPPPVYSPPAPTPSSMQCDSDGCWDNLGGRYNRGAGSTYFPASGGGSCQLIGGIMRCP